MKRLILSFAAIAALLSSCGPRSHAEKTQELIVNHFDSLALNVELVSLQTVDTIYTEMPQDDPTYLELQREYDKAMDKLMRDVDARIPSDENAMNLDAARDRLRAYEKNYKGDFIGYAYEIIVQCDNYDLKKDLESKWYVVNKEGTSFFVEVAHYQEIARTQKKTEELNALLRIARGY